MMHNPFYYGNEVPGDDFCDREQDVSPVDQTSRWRASCCQNAVTQDLTPFSHSLMWREN